MSSVDESLPALSDLLVPPVVRGIASLTTSAYHGEDFATFVTHVRQDFGDFACFGLLWHGEWAENLEFFGPRGL
jgi:hypothetical protein